MTHAEIAEVLRLAAEERGKPTETPVEITDADRVTAFEAALLAAIRRDPTTPQPPTAA